MKLINPASPLLLMIVLLLSSCSTDTLQSSAVHAGIRIGVAEYIGRDLEVALGVIDFTDEFISKLEDEVYVDSERLLAEVRSYMDQYQVSPGRVIIAEEMLLIVQRRISQRYGGLTEPAAVELSSLLSTARRQAQLELSYLTSITPR